MYVKIMKRPKKNKEPYCLFPKGIFNQLNLSKDKLYNLHVGQLTVSVYIQPHEEDNEHGYLPHDVFHQLLLFSRVNLEIWVQQNDIFLGPVVGVFVNTRYLNAIAEGDPPLSADNHVKANEEAHCLLYYFSINNINWVKGKIKGYVFSPRYNQWKKYWLPLPNVVYDRGVGFKKSQKSLVKHIRQQFHYHPQISFINNKDYLGKWQLYAKLSKYPEIKEYLPETQRYKDFTDVIKMLKKYDLVFLKSYYGSRGQEVFSIQKLEKGYQGNFYQKTLKTIYVDELSQLKKPLEAFMKRRSFILQQGIHLYKYLNRSTDMRVLLEKDESGEWQAIYNQVRIAPEKQTITSCSTGGGIDNYEKIYLLSLLNVEPDLPTDEAVRIVAIKIAKFIEKSFGSFGELGMDLALDESGKLWFIEANTKPDKDPEVGLEDLEGISPQCLSIFEYGKFLVKGVLKHE